MIQKSIATPDCKEMINTQFQYIQEGLNVKLDISFQKYHP